MGVVTKWLRKLCMKGSLVACNVFFFAISLWLLLTASSIRQAGWLDVFEDDYPWFNGVYIFLVFVLTTILLAMAITGLYNVFFKRKKYLVYIYTGCTAFAALLCFCLTIEALYLWATARSWKSRRSIDPVIESDVENNFNEVYCLAEAAFLCTASAKSQWLVHFGSDDLRDLFLDPDVAGTVKDALAGERHEDGRSLLDLCEDERSVLHVPVMNHQVANLCTWCGAIDDMKAYVHLVSWANTKCAPNSDMAAYCVSRVWLNISDVLLDSNAHMFYPTSDVKDAVDAPYAFCRKTFLNYWSYLSGWLLVLSLMLLGFMALVLRLVWHVLLKTTEHSLPKYTSRHGRLPERRPLTSLQAGKNQATAKAEEECDDDDDGDDSESLDEETPTPKTTYRTSRPYRPTLMPKKPLTPSKPKK
ncbi:hypothetical protein Poli38472_013038 [Pythium oligandrum]|uniref:Uncharacterized protein n=1 Tax=Pythium oligandrum TaxID=41045 RepID=A0A8K1CIV9_PYTOL|nr:hypothetical protein Poli38472_013038 [Pythium oligandrum]|eukprot:TMW64416.1 hypothetical protein Poli38472_013038 [Pythium oligandrum]